MSKYMYFDFRCPECNTKYDDLVKPDVRTAPCPECGATGNRIVSTPTLDPRMGCDPTMGTMYDKWARTREQKAKLDAKRKAEHGD